MRNFIHKAGSAELGVAEHDDSLTVAEVATQHGPADALVFVDNGEEPADPELTLADAGAKTLTASSPLAPTRSAT
jgi:hypothetical protein